MGYVIIFSFI